MNKRYTLTVDMYIYANDDEDAKRKATKFAEHQRYLYDNQCNVLELHRTPFASMVAEKVPF